MSYARKLTPKEIENKKKEARIKELENTVKQLKANKNTDEVEKWKEIYNLAVDAAEKEIDDLNAKYTDLNDKYDNVVALNKTLQEVAELKTTALAALHKSVGTFEEHLSEADLDTRVQLANNHPHFDVLPF